MVTQISFMNSQELLAKRTVKVCVSIITLQDPCLSSVLPRLVSGGSRGGSMGSMEPLFCEGLHSKILYAHTYYEHYPHTGAMHFSFTVAITHVCQLIPVSRIPRTQSLRARMSEARERIKANILFMHCSLCRQRWRYTISIRALIFPLLTQITSCFAASATQNGVTLLIPWASNTTTMFSSKTSNFYNFTPRIHKKQSQVGNPKIFWKGVMPPHPPSKCFNHI